jgi:septation ring formation regulator EzrA
MLMAEIERDDIEKKLKETEDALHCWMDDYRELEQKYEMVQDRCRFYKIQYDKLIEAILKWKVQ